MRLSTFLVVILTFTTGILTWHLLGLKALDGLAQKTENDITEVSEQKIERARFEAQLAQDRLLQFRLAVAESLPDEPASRPTRDIASLARVGTSVPPELDLSATAFAKGQQLFRDQRFSEAQSTFRGIVSRFPWSPRTVDAYFLWAEAAFQAGQVEESVSAIEAMVELFPEHESTGFALLRLGEIYEKKERIEDAAVVYRMISGGFTDKTLVDQAQRRLSAVRR
jgi:TolA-binding protein